jgi:rhodanese-related sulfurtransferase
VTQRPEVAVCDPPLIRTRTDVDPKTAVSRQEELFLLDVREPAEWRAGHIEGSVHIPMSQLGLRQEELPTDRTILAVCRSGNRSGMVTQALQRAGYEAENLDGGVLAWLSDGLQLVDGDGGPGRVA